MRYEIEGGERGGGEKGEEEDEREMGIVANMRGRKKGAHLLCTPQSVIWHLGRIVVLYEHFLRGDSSSSAPDHGKERVPSHRLPGAENAPLALVIVGRRGSPGAAGEDGVVAEEAQRDDAPRARCRRVARRAVDRLTWRISVAIQNFSTKCN